MSIRHGFPSLALLVAASATACGSLEGNTNTPPVLATLEGEIDTVSGVTPPSGNVRVAVVWQGILPDTFNVAEDLPVQPMFPAKFQIQFDAPPPTSALQSVQKVIGLFGARSGSTPTTGACFPGDGGCPEASAPAPVDAGTPPDAGDLQMAVGIVVAYLDLNGNGKLDLVQTGATSSPDEIVGVNNDLAIIYLQGDPPSPALLSDLGAVGNPTLGYSLYRHSECALMPSSSDAAATSEDDGGDCAGTGFLPFDTLYTLTMTGKPEFSTLLCKSSPDTSGSVNVYPDGATPPGGYPLSGSPGLVCSSDGKSYTLTTCKSVPAGLCEVPSCTSDEYELPSMVPTGWIWPCSTTGGSH
jgi:hypothetical protein